MGRYSQIYDQIWYDEKYVKLDTLSKLVFLYCLTSPHCNMIGYYRLPIAYISCDLNIPSKDVTKAISELSTIGMIKYDNDANVIIVNNYLKYNKIINTKQLAGALNVLSCLPGNNLIDEFLCCVGKYANEYYEQILETINKKQKEINNAEIVNDNGNDTLSISNQYPTDTLSIPYEYPTDEQKQKQKQKQNTETETETTSPANNKKEEKIKYADYVLMTEDEYTKLVDQYGNEDVRLMIEKLDNYKGATGKRYKSDYRAILNWVADEIMKQKNKNNPEPKSWNTLRNLHKKYEAEENQERGEYP